MGLFDSLINLTSSVVKTALTPVAFVADVTKKVVLDEDSSYAEDMLDSALIDFDEAIDDLNN